MVAQWLDNTFIILFNLQLTPFIKNSFLVVLLALSTRFLAIGYAPINSALHRITNRQIASAYSLGGSHFSILRRLYLPLLQGGLFSALLLVFIDVIKEMPITLMTRPFGWDTLAIRIFELSSEGEWERAALPSLCLVLIGLIPVYILSKQTSNIDNH